MTSSEQEALEAELARAEARLLELEGESAAIRARIKALRNQRSSLPPNTPYRITPRTPATVREMTSADKLTLFRQLFHGRGDVFARLWVNPKKQTKGYAPACANE